MKTSRSTNNKQSKQGKSKKPRPEIRDDIASYSGNGKGRGDQKKKGYKGK